MTIKTKEQAFVDAFTQDEIKTIHQDLMVEGNFLDDALDYKLYKYFVNDMPYGTAKARTGDPNEWIVNELDGYDLDIMIGTTL